MTASSQKRVKINPLFKCKHPEMQRKHMYEVYEYQSSTSTHPFSLMFDDFFQYKQKYKQKKSCQKVSKLHTFFGMYMP